MSDTSGAFIAIESPLESYAVRHCHRLKTKLESAGYEVLLYNFPRTGEPSSYFADRYAKGEYGLTNDVEPYAGSLFNALDHFESGEEIRQAIIDGKIVIVHKYIGANMIEQGAKLQHPQERRGYFLWLDNLETRVLNTPRPDRTFILALSPSHAALVGNDSQQAIPAAKQGSLYSELCDLYPKDFLRVDGERNGKELDDEMIQAMLWSLVEPLLPVLPEPELEVAPIEANVKLLENTLVPTFAINFTASQLLSQQLISTFGDRCVVSVVTGEAKTSHLIPSYFDEDLRLSYSSTIAQLDANYKAMLKILLASRTDADRAIVEAARPLAWLNRLDLQLDTEQLKNLITLLLSNPLPEAWELG